jgi:Cu/Ag efflux pump CusA
VILGGLISSTLLNLWVLPIVAARWLHVHVRRSHTSLQAAVQ